MLKKKNQPFLMGKKRYLLVGEDLLTNPYGYQGFDRDGMCFWLNVPQDSNYKQH